MSKSSRDKSAELSAMVVAFKEHGKGLSDVIVGLHRMVEDAGLGSDYGRRVGEIDARFSGVQNDISGLINSLLSSSASIVGEERLHGPPVIIRCKQWEDFKVQAVGAGTVSFLYRSEEKGFQVDALKEGRVYTFSGQLPADAALLKAWLSKELDVEEGKVLEGILAIG